MVSFQAMSTIKGFSFDMVFHAVIWNMIASLNVNAISVVVPWYWGILISTPAFGCEIFWSPLDLGRGITWESRGSNSHNLSKVALCLSSNSDT